MLNKLFKKKPVSAYQAIGGEQGTRQLANRFYDIMESDPVAAELLALHPKPMDKLRQKFFEYLAGWLGGPPLYESQYGHPRLRARHLPFAVTEQMIEQWLYCFNKALNEVVSDGQVREAIRQPITQLARHMRNT
ncbi:group II truncated hemoglobin [Planctobacterium marinum]|uniref:group II truncated hemoglobin n=1 Tax=Planctobacterium marinum TaxID=1631968 RepID=UPI001E49307E|nr:group II truncated hemoglobin [Planctobacterium marinum]MCC2607116.1 group II truncated hemoglobin [Planctobacterium marinum]